MSGVEITNHDHADDDDAGDAHPALEQEEGAKRRGSGLGIHSFLMNLAGYHAAFYQPSEKTAFPRIERLS